MDYDRENTGPGPNTRFRVVNSSTRIEETHDLEWYSAFLEEHVHQAGMQIGPHLSRISSRPAFVVAATGVGKTVAVPVHLFLWLCRSLLKRGSGLNPVPSVIVVEPTIPICRGEADHMNSSFAAFMKGHGHEQVVHPFGAVTGPFRMNTNAPIRFVTTGVFEQMAGDLDPAYNRVVIDEAHRVLAQSPGVEIAASIARSRGVLVDWMSATVDTTDLASRFNVDLILATQQRFPILKVPLGTALEDCIGHVVVQCLSRPTEIVPTSASFRSSPERDNCERTRLHLLTPSSFVDPVDGKSYPGLAERPQGMLVVVNSHQGENSDTRRIADLVQKACAAAGTDIEVLRLASPIVRDIDQETAFRRRVAGIEARRGRYVVIATNVVEMGVTFPSLDYVVTMDTELETVQSDGADLVQERPLSVNAFLQRIGRVGRRRPGMALLTREGETGATFSAWSPNDLAERLRLEPIDFATTRGDVRELAFFLYEREIPADPSSTAAFLARGSMPSRPERTPDTLRAIGEQRALIRAAGLSDDGYRLNERGRRFRSIRIVSDLELGSLFAHLAKAPGALPYLALVTAANTGGLRELLGRRTRLEDTDPKQLCQVIPFALSRFTTPLSQLLTTLRSAKGTITPKAVGADEDTAHHLSELLREGYRVDEPRTVQRDGKVVEPSLITLSRSAISLDERSELLAVYDIVHWFFARYRGDLADSGLTDFERHRVRTALRDEARALGLNPYKLVGLLSRLEELARRARINLGESDRPPAMPSAILKRLTSALNGLAPNARPSVNSQRIVQAYSRLATERPVAFMPLPTPIERTRFLDTLNELGLFVPLDLRLGVGPRGDPVYMGTAKQGAESVQVSVEPGRTCLRPGQGARVRGRVVPIPHRGRDGEDEVRFSLSHASMMA
jgi:hypothetical protein